MGSAGEWIQSWIRSVSQGNLSQHVVVTTIFALLFTVIQVRKIVAERGRLATEFQAARALQQLLLREATLTADGWEAEAAYLPAQEVGGDFYQWARLDGGGLLIATGDVSGKGLRAAMAVSMVCGAFRNRRSDAPGEVLAELNRAMAGALDGGFVTAVVVRCDASGNVRAASAGHPAPWAGGRETALEPGLPLGVVAGAEYEESVIALGTGEPLTLVTDGVIEAASASGELFGFERTAAISLRSAQEIAEAARAWGQNDDITVVTVRRDA